MKKPDFSLLACLFCVNVAFAHSVRYSLHVVDEVTGCALENIPCETIFTTHTGNWNDMSRGRLEKGLTNSNGDYTFTGESDIDHVTFSLRIEDGRFYPVIRRRMEFTGVSGALFKRWEPFDSVVTIRLQRVEHPIPLLVKYEALRDGDKGIGTNAVLRFDLMKGEWLPPYGHGETADMQISSKLKITGKERKFRHATKKVEDVLFYELVNRIRVGGTDD